MLSKVCPVLARPSDTSFGERMVDTWDLSGMNTLQYHMPADMLPFGIVGKIAYAPDLDTDKNSGNAKGNARTMTTTTAGRSATEYQVKAAPIDGLTIGASYMNFDGEGNATKSQEAESGAYMATYASGPFSIGYSKAYKAPIVGNLTAASTVETVDYYDQTNMSVAYAASDNLSVSYEKETSEANYVLNTTADVEQESTSVQIAYTMGGATIAVSHASHDNNGYVDGDNTDQTLFALTMAF